MMRQMAAAATALLLAGPALAQETGVTRHPIPGSDFPIAQAVEIPAGMTRVLLSGTVPAAKEGASQSDGADAFGDTEAQTVSVLGQIKSKLEGMDLSMADVVKMQVYLVAPDGTDAMDFGGFMKGYTQFFGPGAEANLPTRSVFEVAGLANPAFLVEIEVEAVRK